MVRFFSRFVNFGFGTFFSLMVFLSAFFLAVEAREQGRTTLGAGVVCTLLLCGSLLICGGLYLLKRLFEKKLAGNVRLCDRIFLALALILLTVQCAFAFGVDFEPINDLKYVCQAAENYITRGVGSLHEGLPQRHQHYFAVYPNNHALFLIVCTLYKIEYTLTGEITNLLPTAANILGLNLSYIIMYMCARLIYTPERSLLCAVKGLMFLPLVLYAPYFYTDSMCMPWLMAAIFLYMKWRADKAAQASALRLWGIIIACGVVLGIAYKIKGSAVIMIPAFFIDIFFREKGLRQKLLPMAAILLPFALSSAILANSVQAMLDISDEELDRYSFPAIHWVMMSADEKGGYKYEDFMYTKSFEGRDAKVEADIERLKDKLYEQGQNGFSAHIATKITYTWKNVTYMAAYYMPDSEFLKSGGFYILAALLHFSLLISMAASYLSKLGDGEDALSGRFFLKVTLMGLMFFLMLWEARCRYLVSFFPLFALL